MTSFSSTPVDISIIGGGLVGYTAALAFARAGFSVRIFEANIPDINRLLSTEGRAIALAHTSCVLYKNLGLWPALSTQASPMKKILVSQENSFGKCRIDAQDYSLDALGYVIPATHLVSCLWEAVQAHPKIEKIMPFVVESIENFETHASINKQYNTKWVLACDGTDSFARKYFQLGVTEKNYDLHAIVANVTLSPPQDGLAYQRFTEQGVLALLPLQAQRMTSVLTVSSEQYKSLGNISDEEYLKLLQKLLGKRTGLLSDLGKKFAYPLTWVQANDVVVGRTVLLGNAAHTISPIAAQGLNLALRDLAILYDIILENPGGLEKYAQQSAQAKSRVVKFTDKLTDWVKPKSLGTLRGLGLFALDHFMPIKKPFAHSMMGISEHGGSLTREVNDAI